MRMGKLARRFARPLRDFTLGLGLFAGFTLLAGLPSDPSTGLWIDAAHARLLELPPELPVLALAGLEPIGLAAEAWQPELATTLIFAVVCSSLLALNLWFARHLRRAYAGRRSR